MATVHETWDSFWGPLLLLRFHADNPERWSVRETRAKDLWTLLDLSEGDRVVDLGCGDGRPPTTTPFEDGLFHAFGRCPAEFVVRRLKELDTR